MRVDEALIETARSLLRARFADGPGQVTAAYTMSGRTLTGVRVDAVPDPACLCPETGPICEAARDRDLITALVTVAHEGAGSRMVFLTPCGLCLERLLLHTAPDAELAVFDRYAPAGFVIRGYRDLVPRHPALPGLDDHHRLGMRAIVGPLRRMIDAEGVPLVVARFAALLTGALRAQPPGLHGERSAREPSPYARWNCLHSLALRRIGGAFAEAVDRIVEAFVRAQEPALRSLDCNADDLHHLGNGRLGLVNVFANLLQVLESGEPARFELPFEPYDPALLRDGEPMHRAIARDPDLGPPPVDERRVVANLIAVLRSREPGGLVPYLRQRRLFSIPLFPEGTGQCPFARFAEAICAAAADAIEAAAAEELV